jgi:Uma2 family endonuclease
MVITTSPLVKTYTLQEFWDLPEPCDHSKLELIKGVLYMTPPPDFVHSEVAANVARCLWDEIERCGYNGKVYVPRAALWITENTYLEPDLMYLSSELKTEMQPGHWTRADIVIEVKSPSNADYDRKTKSDTYRAMRVREMWLVDTNTKEIEVRSFEGDQSAVYTINDSLRSIVLPRIDIAVSALFG